jgi:hypothetical protein
MKNNLFSKKCPITDKKHKLCIALQGGCGYDDCKWKVDSQLRDYGVIYLLRVCENCTYNDNGPL